MNEETDRAIGPEHAALAGRTGRGVIVAVVDSGVNPGHPHIGRLTGGVTITRDGLERDYVDRLGHGTAVMAAVHEKAPGASLLAVRVFDRTLATAAPRLVRAIDWAVERGARLINLSLGTVNAEREGLFTSALARAALRGAFVVSAAETDGQRWLPGGLPGAIGVQLDWEVPREEIRLDRTGPAGPVLRASGFPRPIPGVPNEQNLSGISFAVANVTGVLAKALEGRPEIVRKDELLALLGPYI